VAEKFLKQYEILLLKAKEDFKAAKYLYDGFQNHNLALNLEIIYFHLQQASEKLLKSLLDINRVKFPRTHDLGVLIQMLFDNKIQVIETIDKFLPLSDFAVEGRYAIIVEDLDDVEKYIILLDALLEFVENKLHQ